MDSKLTFKKEERLSIQKEIDLLFTKGDSFLSYPLRVIYLKEQPLSGASSSVLISVPKKRFKRAVKRNRVKRLIREAYRLNKNTLADSLKENGLLIAFLFVGNELPQYNTIESAVKKALKTLQEKAS